MKKIIANFNSNLLSREDLKNVKGGQDDPPKGCGECITVNGEIYACVKPFYPGNLCVCPNGQMNNACG